MTISAEVSLPFMPRHTGSVPHVFARVFVYVYVYVYEANNSEGLVSKQCHPPTMLAMQEEEQGESITPVAAAVTFICLAAGTFANSVLLAGHPGPPCHSWKL